MTDVRLRPDLKTTGGEVSDILWNDQFIGTMTLVYREADRISGAIQLEEESLPRNAKQRVMTFLQEHIQFQIHAWGVHSCDVMVTYSKYDHIIATDAVESDAYNVEEDHDYDYDWPENERFEDEDPMEQNEYVMNEDLDFMPVQSASDEDKSVSDYFELIVVAESRNKIEYHIYNEFQELVAETSIRILGREVSGNVTWTHDPNDDEIEAVTSLLVSDFDEDEVDTFVINMKWDQEIVETIELTHQDLFEDEDDEIEEWLGSVDEDLNEEDYTIVLARDDGDTLTYEIYQQSYGGLPIGTATVDISERQLTGFIDFREPGNSDDRECITTLLMQELDKEKEFESFNVTMLYQNQPFEELMFETEAYH
ncbi:hypothetical protein GC093_32505 [Paenibacillus sp. LMG 31456]|uniref:Uncharacterized protein n=1 Tax=Paenibacillus foliorum TaxID=2654974 RepID=A0A972K5E3_9BACL|nr:hypothetical protein [Paenibacillus foliorum]NOU97913.1 hypothetical protein [Paenibacillus foliorum]